MNNSYLWEGRNPARAFFCNPQEVPSDSPHRDGVVAPTMNSGFTYSRRVVQQNLQLAARPSTHL
jgi:hypothetical protein